MNLCANIYKVASKFLWEVGQEKIWAVLICHGLKSLMMFENSEATQKVFDAWERKEVASGNSNKTCTFWH